MLQSKSINFLAKISKHCLKLELLKHLLTNISFNEKENHKSLANVTLEPECEEYLCKLIKEGHANVTTIIAAKEIRNRLPVNNIFLYKLQFQLHIALYDREISFNDVSFIAETLNDFDQDGLKKE